MRPFHPEDGIALLMSIGMLFVLTVAGTAVLVMTSANTRNTMRSKSADGSYSLAEAGLAQALSKLAEADDPTDSTILPPDTLTLPPGTATYSGSLAGSTWTLTSTGKIANPTGPATGDVQRTLTRTVTISGTHVGSFAQPNWERIHHDSIFSCFDIPVNLPVNTTANVGMCLQPGGSITGATTKVSAGVYVDMNGPPGSAGPRAGSAATGWTSSANVFSSNNVRASAVVAANGQSPNLDITGFGFTIPAGSRIDGITAVIERSASASSSLDDFDVYLLKGGVATGNDKAVSGTYYPTSDANRTYGNSSDLWGTSWTATDVNASNFGLRLRVDSDVGSSVTAYVDYVSITIDYTAPPTGIGTPGTPVTSFNSPTCRVNGGSWNSPCTSADYVWANTITDNLAIAFKPRINWSFWYNNAAPGPKKPCTETVGTPPAFDSDSTYNGSLGDTDITPESADYQCRVRDAQGNIVGELSWNRSTRVLTVFGGIFFDGNARFNTHDVVVHYQGRATIWISGESHFDEELCAGGSGSTGCRSNMTNWDPEQNLLLIAVGGTESFWNDDWTFHRNNSAFQGILYAKNDCPFDDNVRISGPVLCHRVEIDGNDSPPPEFFPWPPFPAPTPGQAYVGGTTSDIQLMVGNQTG
jgi:hypothetical protein